MNSLNGSRPVLGQEGRITPGGDNTSNSSNSSASARRFEVRIEGPALAALESAPPCVQRLAQGIPPKSASEFDLCVGWLAQQEQLQGLSELLGAPECASFSAIDLRGQPLSPAALECLAKALRFSAITALCLADCGLSEQHTKGIHALLSADSRLVHLRLENNHLDKCDLDSALAANTTLKHLKLDNCGLSSWTCEKILTVLSHHTSNEQAAKNTTLQSLSLQGADLRPSAFLAYGQKRPFEGLGRMPGILWLDLSNTPVLTGPSIVEALFQNFPHGMRLDLNNTVVGPTCISSIVLKLGKSGVAYLSMKSCTVEDRGFRQNPQECFANLLKIPNLKMIDLRGCPNIFEGPPRDDPSKVAKVSVDQALQWVANHPNLIDMRLEFGLGEARDQLRRALGQSLGVQMLTKSVSCAFMFEKTGVPELGQALGIHIDLPTVMRTSAVTKGTHAAVWKVMQGPSAELQKLADLRLSFDWEEIWDKRAGPRVELVDDEPGNKVGDEVVWPDTMAIDVESKVGDGVVWTDMMVIDVESAEPAPVHPPSQEAIEAAVDALASGEAQTIDPAWIGLVNAQGDSLVLMAALKHGSATLILDLLALGARDYNGAVRRAAGERERAAPGNEKMVWMTITNFLDRPDFHLQRRNKS